MTRIGQLNELGIVSQATKHLLLLKVNPNNMSNGTSPNSYSKKSTKKITTAKEVKETKSVPITVELNILSSDK